MSSRIRIFNRSGILIKEPSAPAFREWVVNDIGSSSFILKSSIEEKYIEFGNYLTIEHDKLEPWVGLITTARPWNPKVITVAGKSAMWLFGQRVGGYEQSVSGTWGNILSQMIGTVNGAEPTLLRIGAYNDGVSFSSTVDMSNMYTYLVQALNQSQTRIVFRPVVTRGKLVIYVDMMPTLYSASELKLEEGLNIKNNTSILIEQGDIYNDVTVLGLGFQQEKYTGHAIDMQSIEKYGRRQIIFSEGVSQNDVDQLAAVRLAQYAYPRRTLALTVMDKGKTFERLRHGNSGSVELKSVGYNNAGRGFRGTAYVRVVQFDDKTGEAVLACQEI